MEYTEHYSNSSNNDIENETQEIARIIYDYEIIIKLTLNIILIYAFVSNIFIVSTDVINNNYKLYAAIFLIIILYVLYKFDIITLLKLLLMLILISFIVALLYYNLEKLEFLILFYYSFNYQLEKIYNETKTNYNDILFSFIFIAIISIISIVLYWDNIYTDAKKLSKCGKIINIIENNNKKKKPFVYNIIIINNDLIDTKTSKYVLKITYDFIKKKTIVNHGTDNGYYTDGSESFKKPNYNSELNNKKRILDELVRKEANLQKEIDNIDKDITVAGYDESIRKSKEDAKQIITEMKNKARADYEELKKMNDDILEAEKKLVFFYFNLKTMNSEKIENIDANILNEERFKYILVDDDNNKLPYDNTVVDLIKFTKIYSRNENYNINIINDIIYAKNNREKLFI
jgi:hypothetical protein